MNYYLLVVFNVFVASCSQMLLKQGALKEYTPWWRQYFNPWVIAGYGVLGVTLIGNIFCMSNGVQVKEISIIEALAYLFVPILSFFCFHEKISWLKVCAIATILFGITIFFA
jgi:drug/metabolite transporter (DMT)-like permease